MRLSIPIYERVPQFWFLLGLLFMSSGSYLGFDYSLTFMYFGVGLACTAWSLWIFIKRAVVEAVMGIMAPAQASEPSPAATKAQTEQPQHEGLSQGA